MIARKHQIPKNRTHILLDNVRSAQNVGSILRTAAAFGVETVWCYGITPYPAQNDDSRLPHIQARADKVIRKIALLDQPHKLAKPLTRISHDWLSQFSQIAALEQTENSNGITQLSNKPKTLLIVGNEIDGVSSELLSIADVYEIPMSPGKESLNVSSATAVGLYQLLIS